MAPDIQAIAERYDPRLHAAPIVVGHPKTDDPAYGWVKSLTFADDRLTADLDEVAPELDAMIAAGRYRKLSASFFAPSSPNNPAPGAYYLKHVGVLGAAAPAVAGLKPITETAMASDDDELTICFAAPAFARPADPIKTIAPETAPKTFETFETEETPMPDAPKTADFAEREAELDKREARLARREAELRQAENVEFADELVTAGQLLPAQKQALIDLMSALDNPTADFAEGVEPKSRLRDLLSATPKIVPTGEAAPETSSAAPAEASFAAPEGAQVDPDALALHQQALAYQRQHPETQYIDAVAAVEAAAH